MLIEDFKLEKWIKKYESITKYDISQTCVQVFSLKELEEFCDEEVDFKNIKLGYGSVYGTENLKNAICNLYKNAKSENVTVALGGIGANQLALRTFVNKGDKVVCVVPCYQQVYTLPKIYDALVIMTDIEHLEENSVNAKIICLVNPNNPTGINLGESEVNHIIEIARKNNAYIFADEAYRGLNHQGNPYSKSFFDLYEKTIVTGSMSKTYSLAGLRLGWIVSDKEFINKVNSNRDYNTLSISALDDAVATLALNNHEKIVERNIKILNENKKIIKDFLNKTNYTWIEPNSGTICCINYNSKLNSSEFCEKVVKDTGILLVPASAFDCEKEHFFRIGLGMEQTLLQSGLEKLTDYILNDIT